MELKTQKPQSRHSNQFEVKSQQPEERKEQLPPRRGCKLHVVFRILKDLPRSEAPILHAFQDGYWQSVRTFQQHEQFLEGMLLKEVKSQGKYSMLHYVIFDTGQQGEFLETTEWKEAIGQDERPATPNYAAYEERYTFIDPAVPLLPKRSYNPNVAYLVSMFEADPDNAEQLDQTWGLWSGADYIASRASPLLQLQRVTLHRRARGNKGRFMYILMCELSEALSHLSVALDFVETIRARQCGYTGLYSIDHFF